MSAGLLDFINYISLPFLIFLARTIDVMLLTLRVVLVSKEHKVLSQVVCFIKAFLYVSVLGVLIKNLDATINIVSYALGCGFGIYLGLYVEDKLSLGLVTIRLIVTPDKNIITQKLIDLGYGVTIIDATGTKGDVTIVTTTLSKKHLNSLIGIIETYYKGAFYTIEDAKSAKNGVFISKSCQSS